MSKLTLSDVQTQSGGLHSLLYMLYEASCDLDYTSEKPGATDAANRVNHLIILARDEAERLDTAIGECIDNENAKARANRAKIAPADAPAFDVRHLTMDGLYSVYDAITTVHEVVNAMCCQPRFNTDKDNAPAHGTLMGELADFFSDIMERVRREATTRIPTSDNDRQRKFFFVAEQYTDGLCDPEYAVTGLKKELAKIGGAK
ncbi:hypothetical protein ASD50_15195 [Mesorhizobium sp. Root552]|uniref:hypothetical protein n=1 Tax=Mesorhizobium sp. Root552 TaxID=1736555 RepID=UPI0006FF7A0D|nr:hypothetical protein [Mesorhizobium sp. Root552]KQZ31608.1 hypothetical protein ASD50_15195 [Mesorhizobium sp. Root552]